MRKSVKVRLIILDILNAIHQNNNNFDESFSFSTKNQKLSDKDRSMIYNIVLNSIRNNFFIKQTKCTRLNCELLAFVEMLLTPEMLSK